MIIKLDNKVRLIGYFIMNSNKLAQILSGPKEKMLEELEKEWMILEERKKIDRQLHEEILHGIFICDAKAKSITEEYNSILRRRFAQPLSSQPSSQPPSQSPPVEPQQLPVEPQPQSSKDSKPSLTEEKASAYISKPSNYFLIPDGSVLNPNLKPLKDFEDECVPLVNKVYKGYGLLQCIKKSRSSKYKKLFITVGLDPKIQTYKIDWNIRLYGGFYIFHGISKYLVERELLLLFFIDDNSPIVENIIYKISQNYVKKLDSIGIKYNILYLKTVHIEGPNLHHDIKKLALDSTLEYMAEVGIRGNIVVV